MVDQDGLLERVHMSMEKDKRENLRDEIDEIRDPINIRLFVVMGLALVVTTVLIMSIAPGAEVKGDAMLSNALLLKEAGAEIDSRGLASRVIEQKFQIHMEEADQQMGEIPYVEIWVLNDPFYPLMGGASDLRDTKGTLSGKEWQMLGFPQYEKQEGATPGTATTTQSSSALPASAIATQKVVMVKEIYEIRGIRYATIKVNDLAYDKLKAGSVFGDVFKVQEINDNQTVTVICGDESYELKVGQLRKI